MSTGGGYPSYLLRAMIKAGVRFPSRVIRGAMIDQPLDQSETDIQVARQRLNTAVARAESEGARAKIRAMIMAKGKL